MGERRGSVPRTLRRAAPAALLALALAAGTTAAQSPNLGAYHALVIGNQAYRQLPQLTTPLADVRAVADLLRRDYGFTSVRVLENATRAQMVRALDELRKTLGERDNLLVYYKEVDDIAIALGRAAAPSPPPGPTITKEVVREYGTLAIRGRLAGIEVWLDDRKVGETETGTALVMSNLAAGTYRLKARKASHRDWEREVQVAANQRAEVLIDIEPLGPAKVFKGDDGAETVLVPAGEFWMGSEEYDSEKPRRRVYLDAYYIA